MKACKINENFLVLYILSSAGTYIKEFVHGDLGRTRPSLADVLHLDQPMDILQLDVLGVEEDEALLYNGFTSLSSS